MRILVAGGTGFIGSLLGRRLVDQGHAVQVLTRDPERARQDIPHISKAFAWKANQVAPPLAAFADVDAVINLIGESIGARATPSRVSAVRESRVLGTAHLVDALEKLSPRPGILINASAIGYYGDRGDEILDERSEPGDDFMANLCRDWETEASRAEKLGITVTRLRMGIVLHPAGGALRRMLAPFRLGFGGPLGSGHQWWSWVDIEDLVAIVGSLLERPHSGPLLACSPEPVRQREFASILGRILRRPAILPVPAFALRIAFGDFADQLLASVRAYPRAALERGFVFRHPLLEDALEAALH